MTNLINPHRYVPAGGGDPSIIFEWDPINGTALPSGTFTRATVAEEYDGTDYTQLSSGTIRDGMAAVAAGAKGFIAEPVATNLVIDSDDLSTAEWFLSGIEPPSDQGTTSIGLPTWRIDAGTGSGIHRIFDVVSSNGNHGISVRAKADTGRYLTLRAGAKDATLNYACYDLVGGSITEEETTDVTATSQLALGDNWYECAINWDDPGSVNTFLACISDTATPGRHDPSFTGSNETIDLAIPQIETGLFWTSPIVTSGSTQQRDAEILDTDVTIPSDFSALLDLTLPIFIGAGNTLTLLGPDATSLDILRVDDAGDVIMDDGGTPVIVGTVALGTRFKVSYGRDASGRSASLDGAAAVTGDAPDPGHEGDSFQVGAANSVNQSRCIHHEIILYNEKKSDSELESLSS